jgi:hypothetical protein
MIENIAFLFGGIINNYNFVIILSCAFGLSLNHIYVNPSLILLCEILPGFITQLLYPYYLYRVKYIYKWIILYLTQIISSFILIFSNDIPVILCGICLISINSYLGEIMFLSLSAKYDKKALKFWSMGTGISSLLASGLYFFLNIFLNNKIIFGLNLISYLIGMSTVLYLLIKSMKKYDNSPKLVFKEDNSNNIPSTPNDIIIDLEKQDELYINGDETQPMPIEPTVPMEEQTSGLEEIEEPIELVQKTENNNSNEGMDYELKDFNLDNSSNEDVVESKLENNFYIILRLFIISSSLWMSYFFRYLYSFAYIPLLIPIDREYQIAQFILYIGTFIGRTGGNYVNIKNIDLLGSVHIYTGLLLFTFTILILNKVIINFYIVVGLFLMSNIFNGLMYPIVYHHIYDISEEMITEQWNRERYMGAIGQFTTFFTILASVLGYIIQIII